MFFYVPACSLPGDLAEEEPESVEDREVVEEPEEPVTAPAWYDAASPVRITGDSVYVTASALAADYDDARTIALLALGQQKEAAFTNRILALMEDDDSFPERTNPDDSERRKEALLVLLALDGSETASDIPYSDSEFHFEAKGKVRYYIRHGYEMEAIDAAIRSVMKDAL
ncbi:MAG: hypothetical protein R6U28_13360 [Cyclonatronaceae bacterium]